MENTYSSDLTIKSFAAEVILKHLGAILDEVQGYSVENGIEPVHRIRVASRRLRNALDIFSPFFPTKQINHFQESVRIITSSLGNARDLDVQILCAEEVLSSVEDRRITPGLKRVILRLKQKRDRVQSGMYNVLDNFNNAPEMIRLHDDFAQLLVPGSPSLIEPIALLRLSWETIMKRLQEFLSYEVFLSDMEFSNELHQMRIKAKRLRYSMEVFSPLYPDELSPYLNAARKAQEYLGLFHDCIVWQQYLSRFMDKEKVRMVKFYGAARGLRRLEIGVLFLSDNRKQFQIKNYQNMLQTWEKWKKNGLWQELTLTIKKPLFD